MDTSQDTLSLASSEDLFQDLDSETVVEEYSEEQRKKAYLIVDCLKTDDVQGLRELGKENGGFVCDSLRRMVWPKICSMDLIETSPRPDAEQMEKHPFYNQVILDVNRSLKRFPPSIAEQQRLSMQQQLVILIMRVLIKNPCLHYYQGYHDVCITFLLILGEEMAFHVVNSVSQTHLHMFMEKTMESTGDLLEIIPLIVGEEDEDLAQFLHEAEVGNIFCLSWIITWFSHVLRSYQTVGRLFDLFLVSNQHMALYLTAAIVLHKSEEIKKLNCDLPSVHHYLTQAVEEDEEDIPFEQLIVGANKLMVKYPPSVMMEEHRNRKERRRSLQPYSVIENIVRFSFTLLRTTKRLGFISVAIVIAVTASLYQWLKRRG